MISAGTVYEQALITAAQAGSAQAWEQLVRYYEQKVYNYGLRMTGNPTDAMDLMQEVFLGVYRNLKHFRGDSLFTSWLFRIAHNKAVDMNCRQRLIVALHDVNSRSNSTELDVQEYEGWQGDQAMEPEPVLAAEQLNKKISLLLRALSWEQRLQIELKIYQSLTFEEIAEMQNISVNTSKTRFYSALKKLKNLMEQDNVM